MRLNILRSSILLHFLTRMTLHGDKISEHAKDKSRAGDISNLTPGLCNDLHLSQWQIVKGELEGD